MINFEVSDVVKPEFVKITRGKIDNGNAIQ